VPDIQHGFRAHHSTTHQLVRLTDTVTSGFNLNMKTAAIFLDISKAFDKVWHEGLILKLILFKYPPSMIFLIQSFLSNRKFFVTHQSASSHEKPMTAGVPQGSILAPFLFNIYTSDIPIPTARYVKMALYADDTAMFSSSVNEANAVRNLQMHIPALENWFEKWKIAINPFKEPVHRVLKKQVRHAEHLDAWSQHPASQRRHLLRGNS
jgi:retron-type reverse transcriptase